MRTIRKLIDEHGLIVAPGAFNPLTAKLIQDAGFPAVYLGGNALGMSLCIPEPLTGLRELVSAAESIRQAIDVPLIADANAGFGGPSQVFHTVKACARAGLAGIHIEDQPYPKRVAYHSGKYAIVDDRTIMEKLRVAVEARGDADLAVIGRTDSFRVEQNVDRLVHRVGSYVECGIDMLIALGVTPEWAEEVRKAVAAVAPGLPMIWTSGSGQVDPSEGELRRMGYEAVFFPSSLAVAATLAVRRTLDHIRTNATVGMEPLDITNARQFLFETLGMPTYWSIEERDNSPERALEEKGAV